MKSPEFPAKVVAERRASALRGSEEKISRAELKLCAPAVIGAYYISREPNLRSGVNTSQYCNCFPCQQP